MKGHIGDKMDIRTATKKDIPELEKLFYKLNEQQRKMNPIYNTGEKAKKAIKKEVAKFFKKEKMPRFRIYLAEEKGKIVAFMTCGISKPFDEGWDRRKKIGFLGAAYVLPRHRRKGIMRDLYKEFELWLEKKKIKYNKCNNIHLALFCSDNKNLINNLWGDVIIFLFAQTYHIKLDNFKSAFFCIFYQLFSYWFLQMFSI